jgi:cobalt-zinc-cadmium efflux system protein
MPLVQGMFFLALVGVLVNGCAAYKLSSGKTLNERVLNWHLLEDVLGWVSVLVLSIVLYFFSWPILDPILSIAFTVFIVFNVLKNLFKTLRIFLQAVPDLNEINYLKTRLLKLTHVIDIHKVHIWSLDGEHHVFTAHLVLDEYISHEEHATLKKNISETLNGKQFLYTTIEFEFSAEKCRDGSSKSQTR